MYLCRSITKEATANSKFEVCCFPLCFFPQLFQGNTWLPDINYLTWRFMPFPYCSCSGRRWLSNLLWIWLLVIKPALAVWHGDAHLISAHSTASCGWGRIGDLCNPPKASSKRKSPQKLLMACLLASSRVRMSSTSNFLYTRDLGFV